MDQRQLLGSGRPVDALQASPELLPRDHAIAIKVHAGEHILQVLSREHPADAQLLNLPRNLGVAQHLREPLVAQATVAGATFQVWALPLTKQFLQPADVLVDLLVLILVRRCFALRHDVLRHDTSQQRDQSEGRNNSVDERLELQNLEPPRDKVYYVGPFVQHDELDRGKHAPAQIAKIEADLFCVVLQAPPAAVPVVVIGALCPFFAVAAR
mmetsp:Transcript_103378/g.287848  ORF Transcript_103378/g.287848 Transcript_103378/m.287848 type:complete len:212 (+) Transcript_103378:336-971(+)